MSQMRLQNERAVAYRALCLGALLKRAELEVAVRTADDLLLFEDVRDQYVKRQSEINERLLQWLHEEKIEAHLSEAERYLLLVKPIGSWSERTLISAGWRVESLGIMLWALNRLSDIPSYDTQFEVDDVLEPLDIFQSTIDFVWCARLRNLDELRACRDQAEIWHWRSRATELERLGVRPPGGVTFREIIQFTAEQAYRDGHTPFLIDGDFPAFRRSYAVQTPAQFALTSAIAYERNFAASWICELSTEWESILIDL